MSEPVSPDPTQTAHAPRFARFTLWAIALVHLLLGVRGLLSTVDHFRAGWAEVDLSAGFLLVAIGLFVRSNFWRRVARWADYGLAIFILLIGLAGLLFSDFRGLGNVPKSLGRSAILLLVLVIALLFWWMGRRLGTIRPIFPSPDSCLRWPNRRALIGFLCVSVMTGGSPLTFSNSHEESTGISGRVIDNDNRILWEQGFRDPALVEFRYPTHTRYGLFTKLEITPKPQGYSSEFSYSRYDDAEADPKIAQVQATGDYIICDVELNVTPTWLPIGKVASRTASIQLRGVGKYEGFTYRSDHTARLIMIGLVSRSNIENHIYAGIEKSAMRIVMRNAAPPLKKHSKQ